MTDAYIIETATITAGIVAAHGRSFRFYASHPSMFVLDGQLFSSPKAAQTAAEKISRIPQGPAPRAKVDSSGWGFPSAEYAEAS
jgi:hypothetical protein